MKTTTPQPSLASYFFFLLMVMGSLLFCWARAAPVEVPLKKTEAIVVQSQFLDLAVANSSAEMSAEQRLDLALKRARSSERSITVQYSKPGQHQKQNKMAGTSGDGLHVKLLPTRSINMVATQKL